MEKFDSSKMNKLVEEAWDALDDQIERIEKLSIIMHNDRTEDSLQIYYRDLKEIKEYDKICQLTDFPEPYLSHYYVFFNEDDGFVFLRGTGDWLGEDEMIVKRTKGTFDERYQPDPNYDQWKDEDDNFFTGDKFVYKRLAWGERCEKIFQPDFLVTLKK